MLIAVDSKLQISCFVKFFGKKLEFFKIFNIFGILAYELPNRILILKKSDDLFFGLFSLFLKTFG
jgi:hypothetical protein